MNSEAPPVDEKVLDNTIGGDKNRVTELLGYFTSPSRKVVAEMRHAFTVGLCGWSNECSA